MFGNAGNAEHRGLLEAYMEFVVVIDSFKRELAASMHRRCRLALQPSRN
jgi:hypothetical protein